MKYFYYITIVLLLQTTFSFAQIAIPSTLDDASAELKVYSLANNTGVMIPTLTSAQMTAIASPATGLMVFDIDDNCFKNYDGSNWVQVSACKQYTTALLPAAPNAYLGQIIYNTTTNQMQVFSGGTWKTFNVTGVTLP